MKTFVLIIVLVLLGNTAFAIEDTVDNCSKEADRYLAVTPPKEMLQDIAKQMAQNYAPEKRELFIKIMTQYLDIEAVTKAVKESMINNFTADELAAMAEFYGSPLGMSATKKAGAYMAEKMPAIQAEALKAVAKANREIKSVANKEIIEPAN